jgi:hypothetical protein
MGRETAESEQANSGTAGRVDKEAGTGSAQRAAGKRSAAEYRSANPATKPQHKSPLLVNLLSVTDETFSVKYACEAFWLQILFCGIGT